MTAKQYKMLTKRGHPNAGADRRIYEHVFVMSEMLGRSLMASEVVHHKDEDRGNNSPDNLQLFASQTEHAEHHAGERALIECGNRCLEVLIL